MLPQERIQSWLIDIPDLLLPLDSNSACHEAMARADSPLLGSEHCVLKVSARDRLPFVCEQPLSRPTRTPSPPLSENSSLNSSPYSEYQDFSVSHSRDSSLASGSHALSLSTSPCADHEPLLRRQGSNCSGVVSLSLPPPSVSKGPSLTRRSVSSHCLRPVLPKTRTLTTVNSLDNFRHTDYASIRNAVYIDGEEVGRRLTELIESQIPDSSSTVRFPIIENETSSAISISSLDSPNDIPSKINKKSAETRPRGDSLTPDFTFPLSRHSPFVESIHSSTPIPTPVPSSSTVSSTPALDNLLNVDHNTEQITPTRSRRQSTRQKLVSFISKITSSTPESTPTSPSSPDLKHFSTPSSSTASSYDYLNSTLLPLSSSRQLSVDEFPVGIEDPDPFARVSNMPTVVVSPSLERISVPKIQAAPPPLKKRLRAVSLTTGTTFGTSKAAKATRHVPVPPADVPVLDIGRQGVIDLTQSPVIVSPPASADASVPSPKFIRKMKNPFTKMSSPVTPQPISPPTPEKSIQKRMSLNPILPQQPTSKATSPCVPNTGILEHFLFK